MDERSRRATHRFRVRTGTMYFGAECPPAISVARLPTTVPRPRPSNSGFQSSFLLIQSLKAPSDEALERSRGRLTVFASRRNELRSTDHDLAGCRVE